MVAKNGSARSPSGCGGSKKIEWFCRFAGGFRRPGTDVWQWIRTGSLLVYGSRIGSKTKGQISGRYRIIGPIKPMNGDFCG
jgi:hypothetical protein